jgi:hypothetical protein
MIPKKKQSGLSLVEVALTLGLAAIVFVMFWQLFPKYSTYFTRTRVRQEIMQQSRTAMDAILRILRNGKANTLIISTPAAIAPVPNSRVDFVLHSTLPSGATAYAIYLANRGIFTQEFNPNLGGAQAPRQLVSNATSLMFTGDYLDPSTIYVSMRIDAPWDQTGDPTHVSSLLLPNQAAHLVGSP